MNDLSRSGNAKVVVMGNGAQGATPLILPSP